MQKRRKFYKYTLVPLFSLVLSLVLLGKSVEAATWFGTAASFNISNTTSYIGSVRGTGYSGNPDEVNDMVLETMPSVEDTYPRIREYVYHFSTSLMMSFSGNIYTDSQGISYNDGYLNGLVYFTYPCTITRNGSETIYGGIQASVSIRNNSGQGYRTYLGASYLPNGSGTMGIGVVFDNFPVYGDLDICTLDFIVSYKVTSTYHTTSASAGDEWIQLTPGAATINQNYVRGSNIASANNGIAGEIYAAIENSQSVQDIVTYLNWIEDAAGDINVAVSHINQTLLPNVITYLQSLIANTNLTNTKLNTLINYLNVISSTWPDYSAQVLFYLSQLVNMNEEQSSLAAEVESQYQAKASEGAELNQGMQVVIPTVNQDSFNINANVDSGTVTTLSAFWALFPANALIGTLFAIAIAGIAAGFFLYGKKR